MLDPTLLYDVLLHPKDDAPRLALAEKLRAAGDPRGELIVAQCRLAQRGLSPAERHTLRRRVEELRATHGDAWSGNAAGLGPIVFRRGFVDEVATSGDALAPRAGALFASEPITRLVVTNAPAFLAPLAMASAFSRVLHLTLRGPIGDAGAKLLATALSHREAPIERLNLDSCGVGPEGISALAGSMGGCVSLALTGNPLGDEGVAVLARTKGLASLVKLYLSETEMTDEGATALAKGAHVSLTHLAVARNELTTAGLAALAKSKKLRRLRWLEYTDPEEGMQAIAVRGAA
jgi:uncharacterized protein (TIGR02996 family)